MRDFDERHLLLTKLDPRDRATLEAMVDGFIHNELPSSEAASIAYAAQEFERRAEALPSPEQVVVRRFAAALRERLARLRCH